MNKVEDNKIKYIHYNDINKYLVGSPYCYEYLQCQEINAFDMYYDIFNGGEDLQTQDKFRSEPNKYNLICSRFPKDNKLKNQNILIHKGLNELKDIINSEDKYFDVLSCISYMGFHKYSENARFMYAMIIDLDYLTTGKEDRIDSGLAYIDRYINARVIKTPNYIVASGHGVHLYYCFKDKLPMFEEKKTIINNVRKKVIDTIWTIDISAVPKQYGALTQSFRVGGTYTKNYKDRTICYKCEKEKYTLSDIVNVLPSASSELKKQCLEFNNKIDSDREHLTLEKAKKLYPVWYQNRVIDKKPKKKYKDYKKWNVNPALYEWWLNKVNDSVVGGRFYYCVALCVYAIKCNISEERLKKDLLKVLPILNDKTITPKNQFTRKDMRDAIYFFKDNNFLWSRKAIEEKTLIPIPPNRRNGRTRAEHIEYMNFCKMQKNKKSYCLGGRKPKKEDVLNTIADIMISKDVYYDNTPITTKEIMEKCHISKHTAIKYKKLYFKEI